MVFRLGVGVVEDEDAGKGTKKEAIEEEGAVDEAEQVDTDRT